VLRRAREPPAADGRALDRLLSFGERASAALFASKLSARGVAARALHAGEAGS